MRCKGGWGESAARAARRAQSIERNHELGGTLVTQVTATNTYGSFGNATELVISTDDGFVTRTVNTYTNDTAKWHLGRLTRAEVTHTPPAGTALTRVSTFAYDPASGLLTRETIEPGTALEQVTAYTLDAYGNRTAVSVSGPGVSARTATTTDTVTRAVGTTYDAYSRPHTLTYPGGFAVEHAYDAQGALAEVRNAATQALYWRADAAWAARTLIPRATACGWPAGRGRG